jgi:glycosyl transferase family 25
MLDQKGMAFEFINEGKDNRRIQSYLNLWMKNGQENMLERVPRVLCTVSHFLVYQRIVAEKAEGALILEDDNVLHDDFLPKFEQSLEEYRQHYADKKVLISYEDSSLLLIPRSQRKKGKMLYEGKRDRLSGAYFINHLAARAILDHLENKHCDRAIDCYHNLLIQEGVVDYFWCHPALATQGSFTGAFRSALSKKKDRMIEISWWFKKNYKQLLYWFR